MWMLIELDIKTQLSYSKYVTAFCLYELEAFQNLIFPHFLNLNKLREAYWLLQVCRCDFIDNTTSAAMF